MKERKRRKTPPARRRFDRALAESADLLSDLIGDIRFEIPPDDFVVYELARLIREGEPSFRNEDFRFLVQQGIRLHVSPNLDTRARLVDRLRRGYSEMSPAARKIAPDVIGAIEDADFALDKVGAVVRTFTSQLLKTLEATPQTGEAESQAREHMAAWRRGATDRNGLLERMQALGPAAVPAVADLLFESLDDPALVDVALELLSALESPVSARVLAYMVSEPILEEPQEERARAILKRFWPMPRPYMLYKLRQHTHEDIPFRWLELFVETDEVRAVDRILEEVLAHARAETYREDLIAALGLLDRSRDPGIVGKALRLMTEEAVPEAVLQLMEEWVEESRWAEPVEHAMERWHQGQAILVSETEDFNTFAARQTNESLEQIREDWNASYHESLGWQQRSAFPRGPLEWEFEQEVEDAMMRELSLNPRLDETELHDQIESFRENWLTTPKDDVIPLVAIYLERPRDDPWQEEIYRREINGWYIKAAQFFDEGNVGKARQYVDIILQIEPDYPLAKVLDGLLKE